MTTGGAGCPDSVPSFALNGWDRLRHRAVPTFHIFEGTAMSEHTQQRDPEQQQQQARVTDLPDTAAAQPQHADQIKGGLARRGGDDDLDDLEVER